MIAAPAFFQIVLGVSYGAAATPETMIYLRNLLPEGAIWAAFGIGPHAYPMLAQACCSAATSASGSRTTTIWRRA